jgi:hypothetical protein
MYEEVKGTYGANGNVSVPPAVILKMMLLLVPYNARSKRELMLTISERMETDAGKITDYLGKDCIGLPPCLSPQTVGKIPPKVARHSVLTY